MYVGLDDDGGYIRCAGLWVHRERRHAMSTPLSSVIPLVSCGGRRVEAKGASTLILGYLFRVHIAGKQPIRSLDPVVALVAVRGNCPSQRLSPSLGSRLSSHRRNYDLPISSSDIMIHIRCAAFEPSDHLGASCRCRQAHRVAHLQLQQYSRASPQDICTRRNVQLLEAGRR